MEQYRALTHLAQTHTNLIPTLEICKALASIVQVLSIDSLIAASYTAKWRLILA